MAQTPSASPQTLSHYTLGKKLGEGAMGQVWLARDKLLARDVAIKVLHAGATNSRLVKDFVREAQSAARLNHPNTVTIHQIGKDGNRVFIAMEYVQGGSLADELRDKGALPWREATQAIRDAAAGLQAAHDMAIVHRDVKPSNLMRSSRGMVKVVDFGLAKARDGNTDVTQTQPGTIMGSPAYMSPEQCRGEPADARSDLYSLVCAYYQLLTRQLPFAADQVTAAMYMHCHEPFPDPADKGFAVPDSVRRILAKGSRKLPAERYQTAAELLADLDAVLQAPAVSHTFEGKTASPSAAPPVAAKGVSIGSIIKGKGIMGKTTWAAAVITLALLLFATLRHPAAHSGADSSVHAGAAGTQPVAVPSMAAQYKAEHTIKDVFKAEYAKGSAFDRVALAKTLLDQGRQTDNDLAAKFVMFREARDLAAGTGDYATAFEAVDATSAAFVVDATELKAGALQAAAPKIESPHEQIALARACLELTDAAVSEEKYVVASRLIAIADAAGRKAENMVVLSDVQEKGQQVRELRADFDRRTAATQALAKDPLDPAANATLGKSLCFMKGSWETGLPLLAKGSDVALSLLARKELAHPAGGTARMQLADAWWDVADHEADLAKARVKRHAAEWYAQARPDLVGLDLAKAESRIPDDMKQQVVAASPPVVPAPVPQKTSPPAAQNNHVTDLMSLIDTKRDKVEGDWRLDGGVLSSPGADSARLQIPFTPPGEYEWTVVAERTQETGHGLVLGFIAGASQSTLIMDGFGRTASGLEEVDGAKGNQNATTSHQRILPIHQPVTIVLKVLRNHVTATYDGKTFVDWSGEEKRLSVNPRWKVPVTTQLFIGAQTPIRITKMSISAPAQPVAQGGHTMDLTPPAAPIQLTTRTDADGHRVVDLLPLIDPTLDTEVGGWKRVDGQLTASGPGRQVLGIPFEPPKEYDLVVDFAVNGKDYDIGQFLTHDGRGFCLAAKFRSTAAILGFDTVAGKRYTNNATTLKVPIEEAQTAERTIVIRVRNDSVSALLDGKPVAHYATGFSDLGPSPEYRVGHGGIGLMDYSGEVTYRKVELVEVSGQGRAIPRPADGPRLVRAWDSGKTGAHWKEDVRFSTDGRRVIVISDNSNIFEADSGADALGFRIGYGHFSADGSVAAKHGNAKLELWDVSNKSLMRTLTGDADHPDPGAACFSPDGRSVAVNWHKGWSGDNLIEVYDVKAGGAVASTTDLAGFVSETGLAFSPDGSRLAAGIDGQELSCFEVKGLKKLWATPLKSAQGDWLSFSHDGTRIVASGFTSSTVVDARDGTAVYTSKGPDWNLWARLSSDGRLLLTAGTDAPQLSDVNEGKVLPRFADKGAPVWSVGMSSDGNRALAGRVDGSIDLFDIPTGRLLQHYTSAGGRIIGCNFAPDGRTFATVSQDDKVRVFRVP